MTDTADIQLAAQYEAFPYPQRDPADEARRLIIGSPSHLREIDHWVFGARRPRSTPFRALVAGGGTGDATVMLATHLARDGRPASVTYIDRSRRATAIAQARIAARGLENVTWKQLSILDLPGSGLGPFDYIDCCGVLHHLPDPAAGLRALLSVLAPGGGMGLMLYAPHGRTGVYMLQDALRLVAPPDQPPAARLDVARRVMRHLPDSAWLRFNRSLTDHVDGGDAGLYDVLLNHRDRAFDIPAVFDLAAGAGLRVTCLVEPIRYDPAIYLPDPKLRALAQALPPARQAALAELLTGNIAMHVFYCVRADEWQAPADATAADAVPVSREVPAAELARNIRPDGTLAFIFDGLRVSLPMHRLAAPILTLIDGHRSVGDILATLRSRGIAPAQAERGWREVWETFSRLNRVLLAPPE